MKIAVTCENGQVFQHFGHTEQFELYETDGSEIRSKQLIGTNGSGHGALAGLLRSLGVDVLICGGIGGGAQQALSDAGIRFYGGVNGSCDEAVTALLAGSLAYEENAQCEHHAHGEGGTCGEHGCGTHSCTE